MWELIVTIQMQICNSNCQKGIYFCCLQELCEHYNNAAIYQLHFQFDSVFKMSLKQQGNFSHSNGSSNGLYQRE